MESQLTSEHLWQQFQGGLGRFLARRVPASDVDDILQDVFVKIHRSLDDGQVPRDLAAWVYQVARHATIDHYRRRASDRLVPVQELPEVVDFPEVEEPEARDELVPWLRLFVDDLKPDYRDALPWTAFEGLTQVDAAKRAGISVSGMKSRVQRGREALVDALKGCCEVVLDARGRPMDVVRHCQGECT